MNTCGNCGNENHNGLDLCDHCLRQVTNELAQKSGLKPCPFCGGNDIETFEGNNGEPMCNCRKHDWMTTEINDWNTRPIEDALNERIKAQEELIERYEDALHEISKWGKAYPLEVFPEPDIKKARELLKAGGMTIDAISVSNMRHVVKRVSEIADNALNIEISRG